MEAISIAEALSVVSGINRYQHKLFVCLALSCFTFSSFLFNLPLLLLDHPSAQNMTNYFLLYEEDYVIRTQIKHIFLAGIPIGGLVLSYFSDKLGRHLMLKYLLRWEIVFLVFAAICFTPYFLMANCFFLGLIVFTGISICFLYLYESVDYLSVSFYAAGLISSIFLSYFIAHVANSYGFNWRLILLGNAILAGISLYLTTGTFESVEWLAYTAGKDETESVLTKIAEVNGKVEEIELLEPSSDTKKGVFTLSFLCSSLLWTSFLVLLLVFKHLAENFFLDVYWELSILGCSGVVLSGIIGWFLPLTFYLRLWTPELIAFRGCIVLLYFASNNALKLLLFLCVPGLLTFELTILSILTKIELGTSFRHTVFAIMSLTTSLISNLIYSTLLIDQKPSFFYITVFFLILTSVIPANYLKWSNRCYKYFPLSQDSEARD